MNTRTMCMVMVALVALIAATAQADYWPGHNGGGYVRLTDDMTSDGTTSWWGDDAVSAMYQGWDGSSLTVETRVAIPTGDVDINDIISQNQRAAGIYLMDTTNNHRYIIGLRPGRYNDTTHYGMGNVSWENAGALWNPVEFDQREGEAGLTASDGWVDFRVTFNSTTKAGEIYYRAPGGSWTLLASDTFPASFSPDRVGLGIWHANGASSPGDFWAPAAGQQLDFDYFSITGGTGSAQSDDFTWLDVTESLGWTYLDGQVPGGTQGTSFLQVEAPEPLTMGMLSIGALGVLLRQKRRRA